MEELGAGYRPWSHKESGTTEQLLHFTSDVNVFAHILQIVNFMHTVENLGLALRCVFSTIIILELKTPIFICFCGF